jgi:hypothetical protein
LLSAARGLGGVATCATVLYTDSEIALAAAITSRRATGFPREGSFRVDVSSASFITWNSSSFVKINLLGS